jgi:hypothetical protein
MTDLITKIIQAAYYYEGDKMSRRPVWKDTALIGVCISIVVCALGYYGFNLSAETQSELAAVIVAIGVAFSDRVGVKPKPVEPTATPAPRSNNAGNITNLS